MGLQDKKTKQYPTEMSAFIKSLGDLFEKGNQLNLPYYLTPYEQISEMSIWERCKLYNFTFEAGCVIVLLLLLFVFSFGKNTNVNTANKIYGYLNDYLKTEFSTVAFYRKGENTPYVEENSNTFFTSFATGRAYIESVTVRTELLAKFNPLSIFVERLLRYYFAYLFTDAAVENIEITIKPNNVPLNAPVKKLEEPLPSKYSFISAIVSKSCMNKSRVNNYYMGLTQVVESPNLPIEYIFMSESNQLNSIFKKLGSGNDLNTLLKKSSSFLNYLAFTDLPSEKPLTDTEWEKNLEPRCVISTKVTTDPKELKLITELIDFVFTIYEHLSETDMSVVLSGDISKKVKNLRTQELNKIVKTMKEVALEMAKEKKQEDMKKTNPQAEAALLAKRERRKKHRQQKGAM